MGTMTNFKLRAGKFNRNGNGRDCKVYGPDRIALVGFNDEGFVICRPAEPFAHWLQERSQELHEKVSGCTNITDGLRKGLDIFNYVPKGVLKRIYLLSDGYPNIDTEEIMDEVEKARKNYVNINTIGFGDEYDEALLRTIAGATHNGKFIHVNSLRELSNALIAYDNGDSNNHHRHRSETTVLVIDLSGSMFGPMEGKTKVQIVEEAIMHLILAKQKMFG